MASSIASPSPDTLAPLAVPSEYAAQSTLGDLDAIVVARLDAWRVALPKQLDKLQRQYAAPDQGGAACTKWDVRDQARWIAVIAPLSGPDAWTTPEARHTALDLLAPLSPASEPLLQAVLLHELKPLFAPTPHPSLNIETGRRLAREAGGPGAFQDHYEGQAWKRRPGTARIVAWCVENTQADMYARLWHLLIPPLMTLLDDYEAPYKIEGIKIVSGMLETVPPDLLKRTGVDSLIFNSLMTSLTHLNTAHTPTLLRLAVRTSLTLIERTTAPGSEARFAKLCTVLGDNIVGNVWIYGERDRESIRASVEVLPAVVRAMGIGCARYLKALIPQLTHPLLEVYAPYPPTAIPRATLQLQLASSRALEVVIDVCAVRMERWRTPIVEALVKAWVALHDSRIDDESSQNLKDALQNVRDRLAAACPSVIQEEYRRFAELDPAMFGALLSPRPVKPRLDIDRERDNN